MSAEDQRMPWLQQYEPAVPPEIGVEYPHAPAMFAATARRDPDAVCLGYFDTAITFRTVGEHAAALAAALLAGGLAPGDRVGILLQNVPQWLIAELAVWRAGGIVVALSPMFKARELHYHLRDSGARVLICLESLHEVVAEALPGTAVARVIATSELDYLDPAGGPLPTLLAGSVKRRPAGTDDFLGLIAAHAGQAPPPAQLSSSSTAILTYTSGTTGVAKGAMNTHGNLVFTATLYREWFHLDRTDTIIGVAPLFHISGLIAHLALCTLVGMPCVLFYRFDAAEFLRLIERWRARFTMGSITVFIAARDCPAITRYDLSSATKMTTGGAPVAAATLQSIETAFGNPLHVVYGLTETTSPATARPMGRQLPVDPDSGALSVGVPVCNTRCRVVDPATRQILPPGEAGELVIEGPQVVPGYWGKPEETAHALPSGVLHTGDVARIDAEGFVYIVDRIKDMIIASGYKIWPREVEDVLLQHPAVREAAVIGLPDAYRGETVKAFVSLRPGTAATEPALIAFCRERMAAYKSPRAIEILDELPKTVTGKYLRRELRALEGWRQNQGAQ